MIQLNLLPKELRKKKTKQMPKINVLPICIGVVGIMVFAYLLLAFLAWNNTNLSKTLKGKWEQMQPQKEKTDSIARETNELERRITAVRKIARPELSWTKVLSGLNQAMIPGVWLSDFRLEFAGRERDTKGKIRTPTALTLSGYALGRSEVATTSVARFLNSLKKNKDFSGYFDDIELQNMRNSMIGDEEVMMFKLICKFKQPEGAVEAKVPEKKFTRKRRR